MIEEEHNFTNQLKTTLYFKNKNKNKNYLIPLIYTTITKKKRKGKKKKKNLFPHLVREYKAPKSQITIS